MVMNDGRTWYRKHKLFHSIEKNLSLKGDKDMVCLLQLPERCLRKIDRAIQELKANARIRSK